LSLTPSCRLTAPFPPLTVNVPPWTSSNEVVVLVPIPTFEEVTIPEAIVVHWVEIASWAVELMVTLPPVCETDTFAPARILVTIPVKYPPGPRYLAAVIIPTSISGVPVNSCAYSATVEMPETLA